MNQNFLLAMPGTTEMLVLLAVVLILFGGSKIPKLMGGFGKGIKEFKKGIADADEDKKEASPELAEGETAKQLKENSES